MDDLDLDFEIVYGCDLTATYRKVCGYWKDETFIYKYIKLISTIMYVRGKSVFTKGRSRYVPLIWTILDLDNTLPSRHSHMQCETIQARFKEGNPMLSVVSGTKRIGEAFMFIQSNFHSYTYGVVCPPIVPESSLF